MNLNQAKQVLAGITGGDGTLTDQLSQLSSNISDSYAAITELGGSVPEDKNTENLPDAIETL